MRRIFTGFLIGGGWLLLLLYGPFLLFWLIISVAGGIGLYEYYNLVFNEEEKKYIFGAVFIGLLPLFTASAGRIDYVAAGLFVSVLFLVIFVLVTFQSLGNNGLNFLARSGFGIFYIGFCLAHLILIRALPQGILWLLVLTSIAVGSDAGAYYVGKAVGKTKLYPAVSPGKTRAGAVGGLIIGVSAALLTAGFFFTTINLFKVAVAAAVLTCIGMIGDLAESVIKRSVEAKDSGKLLPGHGGLLDRGDSLLLSGPALFYLLYFSLPV